VVERENIHEALGLAEVHAVAFVAVAVDVVDAVALVGGAAGEVVYAVLVVAAVVVAVAAEIVAAVVVVANVSGRDPATQSVLHVLHVQQGLRACFYQQELPASAT
jgi:hypothetical protein